MKNFLLSLFILLAFDGNLIPATASGTVEIDGKPVKNDNFVFFMLPVIRGRSPGMTGLPAKASAHSIRNETCPQVIGRDLTELSFSMPVEIPTPKGISILSTSLDYRLDYLHYPLSCSSEPSSWTVVEELPEGFFFKIGKFQKKADGWFKLKSHGPDPRFDKLVFCNRSDHKCGDVGIFADRRNMFLIAIK